MDLKPLDYTKLACPYRYRPVKDYIQVEWTVPTERGGILLPEGMKTQFTFLTCTAIEIGPDCKWVKKGDKIVCASASIMQSDHDGHKYNFTQEDKIAAILDELNPEDKIEPFPGLK